MTSDNCQHQLNAFICLHLQLRTFFASMCPVPAAEKTSLSSLTVSMMSHLPKVDKSWIVEELGKRRCTTESADPVVKYISWMFLNGPTRPLFVYFRSFNQITQFGQQCDKWPSTIQRRDSNSPPLTFITLMKWGSTRIATYVECCHA